MNAKPTVRVVRHKHADGEVEPGAYDVIVDGVRASGVVRRRDSVSAGYWGRWHVGHRHYCTTRAEAVQHVVDRHLQTTA